MGRWLTAIITIATTGLTVKPNPDGVQPSVTIVSFKECNAATSSEPASVRLVDMKDVRPKVVVTPVEAHSMAGGDFGEKKCGVYVKDEGKLTLCIESVSHWGDDVVQVNGFLENSGPISLCDVKIKYEDDALVYSAWPEWARVNQWENDFAPKQSTAVGLTAPARPDGSYPHITVTDFNVCGKKSGAVPAFEVVDLELVKSTGLPATEIAKTSNSRKLAVRDYIYITAAQAVDKSNIHPSAAIGSRLQPKKSPYGSSREDAKRMLQAPKLSRPVTLDASRPPKAGECALYKNGKAEVALCIDSIVQWGSDRKQVSQPHCRTPMISVHVCCSHALHLHLQKTDQLLLGQ